MFAVNFLLLIAGFGSLLIVFYVFAMGIGSIRDKMKSSNKSNLQIEFFSFAIWVPVIVSIWFLTKK